MQIVYVAGCYGEKTLDWCRKEFPSLPQLPGQKFHKLMVKGFAQNQVENIHVVAEIPVMGMVTKDIELNNDIEDGIVYHYLKYYKYKNRTLNKSKQYKEIIEKLVKEEPNSIVICDVLRPSCVASVQSACRKYRVPCYGIATDIPIKKAEKGSLRTRLANSFAWKLITRFDGYIFLTEAMNELTNKNKKPYIVVECLVEAGMVTVKNELIQKKNPRICLYAGGIRRVYGIPQMVEGFLQASVPDVELHIYGSGDYSEDLLELCKKHNNVKFFGVVPNREIVAAEIQATLLINPRPTDGEYTKYSFPSKNMEYMASGTPVLTTKLPGMPKEYSDYVYWIEEETIPGITKALTDILNRLPEELHEKGISAKRYVLENKNNYVQAKRVLDMITKHNKFC